MQADRLVPHASVPVRLLRASGTIETFEAVAAVDTALEVTLLGSGGMIAQILGRAIFASRGSALYADVRAERASVTSTST